MGAQSILRVGRFASVGVISTLAYFVFGWALARLAGLPPVAASALAYAGAATISYLGHRSFTFRSGAAHGAAVPRFAAVTLTGFAVAAALTALGERLGLPVEAGLLATCVAIPAINYVVLERAVFPAVPRADSRRAHDGV